MDIGSFKRRQDDDDEAWTSWLGEPEPKPRATPVTKSPRAAARQLSRGLVDGFRSQPVTKAIRPLPASQEPIAKPQTISIQIHMPEFHVPKVRVPWVRLRPWLIGGLVVIGLLLGGKLVVDSLPSGGAATNAAPQQVQATLGLGYKPLVPSPRPESAEQPSEPKYNNEKQLYSYNDQYENANLTVDQQAVPQTFLDDPSKITDLAESISYTDSFDTTLGKAYIYAPKDAEAQRLVLVNKKMILFVQSTERLEITDWVKYLQDLK